MPRSGNPEASVNSPTQSGYMPIAHCTLRGAQSSRRPSSGTTYALQSGMDMGRFLGRHAWWAAGATAVVGWRALTRARSANLKDEVVLVTGGSRGLGLELAREFGRQGCKVAVCARD